MNYRLTALTPLLVGDGQRLSPIDYMVWKDQVNVLDQRRIFRLLAKGPRLEGYLTQIRKAEILDFANWGGFAQNFAERRIPFEHASLTPVWQRQRAETLFIPTFAGGPSGAYLPGTALKGALRTGLVVSRWNEGIVRELTARLQGERAPRRPGESAEASSVGLGGASRTRFVNIADSGVVAQNVFRVYMLRTATLVAKGGGKLEPGWKQAPRGSVDNRRIEDSTPTFAEMAAPGTVFQGGWQEGAFFREPEIVKALHWREAPTRATVFAAANAYAARQLEAHLKFAQATGLGVLASTTAGLLARLGELRESNAACLVSLGWGGGFFSKSVLLDTESESVRGVLRLIPFYQRAIQSGLPFPKTRRIVFLANQPATLPGWAQLEVA